MELVLKRVMKEMCTNSYIMFQKSGRNYNLGYMLVDICEIRQKALANLPKVLIFDLLARRVTINDLL